MKLSGRQLAVMRVLWERGEATVAQLQQWLDVQPPLAYSTVATVLSRMERKGLVTHRRDERVYYYRPAVSEDRASRTMVGELMDRIFEGSPSALVNHLLESEHVDARELRRIKKLVAEHEARLKSGRSSQ